ncbi:hypothetical protein CPB84DRAFT_1668297, partial [Gymnopilus junonius]
VLCAFKHANIDIGSLLEALLIYPEYSDHNITISLVNDPSGIARTLINAERTHNMMLSWTQSFVQEIYQFQMQCLIDKKNGFHFFTKNMTEEQLRNFSIEDLAQRMQTIAPDLWDLFGSLLAADPRINYQRAWVRNRKLTKERSDGDIAMEDVSAAADDDVDEYFQEFGSDEIQLTHEDEDEPENTEEQVKEQFDALKRIKQVLCLSVMMHSSNKQCNTLQSVVGVFLHSCNAPETVQELLAHMGILVVPSTINQVVSSLSAQAETEIRRLGQTFL